MNNFNGPPQPLKKITPPISESQPSQKTTPLVVVKEGFSYADGQTPEQILQKKIERVRELIKTCLVGQTVRFVHSDGTIEDTWKAVNILNNDKVFVVSENNERKYIPIDVFLKWQGEFAGK